MIRRTAALLLGLVLLGTVPASAAGDSGRIEIDEIKIAVNNEAMTRRELEEVRAIQHRQLEARLQGDELQQELKRADEQLVQNMIEDLLIQSFAARQHIEIPDKTLEERVDAIVRREPRMADLYSEQQLKRFVLRDLLRRRVIGQEVESRVYVSNAEIVDYCESQARENREVDVGHILVRGHDQAALEKIRHIRTEIEQGEDFTKAAKQYSEDPSVANNGGRLGYISRGQFVKPFEEKAFSMKPGELSEPVETRFGYHLIKVFGERTKEVQDCHALDDVTRQSYHSAVYNRERQRLLERFLTRLREHADIHVYD